MVSTKHNERCPMCGKFCGVVYEWRGAQKTEVASCTSCGYNVPNCCAENGTVKGCKNDATHVGAQHENKRERYWCEEHAPEDADLLPYMKDD